MSSERFLGSYIRLRRELLNMSMPTVAAAAGYERPNFVCMIETNKSKFPIRKWKAFATCLRLDPELFLEKVISFLLPDMRPYLSFHSAEEEEDEREKPKVPTEIARLIKARREEIKMTRVELAEKLLYKLPTYIVQVESGRARFPLGKWQEFAEVLDVPREKFLEVVILSYFPDMMPYLSFHSAVEPKPAY